MLNTHPASIRDVLNVDVITGNAIEMEVLLIDDNSNDKQHTAKTRYLDEEPLRDKSETHFKTNINRAEAAVIFAS